MTGTRPVKRMVSACATTGPSTLVWGALISVSATWKGEWLLAHAITVSVNVLEHMQVLRSLCRWVKNGWDVLVI